MNAINFKDLPIELWEIKMYDNNVVLYNQLLSQDSKESIKTITKNNTINKVSSEVKVYTLEDHLNIPEDIKNLFFALREKIFLLSDSIEERPKQNYVAYRLKNAFVYIHNQKTKIKIHLEIRKKDLDDPKNMARDVESIGHHGGGETEVILNKSEDLNYIFGLIEQAYNKMYKKS